LPAESRLTDDSIRAHFACDTADILDQIANRNPDHQAMALQPSTHTSRVDLIVHRKAPSRFWILSKGSGPKPAVENQAPFGMSLDQEWPIVLFLSGVCLFCHTSEPCGLARRVLRDVVVEA